MTGSYWDTSVVLKLYCREEDSPRYLERVAKARDPLISSAALSVEMMFALYQKELRGALAAGEGTRLYDRYLADVGLGRFLLVPWGDDVREAARGVAAACYSAKPPVAFRALDGLHLASAKLAGCRRILTTDSRMRLGAVLVGLEAEG